MSASTKTTSIAPPHARFLVAIIDGSAARLLGVALRIRLILLTECVTHAKLTLGLKIILFSADSGKETSPEHKETTTETQALLGVILLAERWAVVAHLQAAVLDGFITEVTSLCYHCSLVHVH